MLNGVGLFGSPRRHARLRSAGAARSRARRRFGADRLADLNRVTDGPVRAHRTGCEVRVLRPLAVRVLDPDVVVVVGADVDDDAVGSGGGSILAAVLQRVVPGVEGAGDVPAVAVSVVTMDVHDEADDPRRCRDDHSRRRHIDSSHVDAVDRVMVVMIVGNAHGGSIGIWDAIDPGRQLKGVIGAGPLVPEAERERAGESCSGSDFPLHVRLQGRRMPGLADRVPDPLDMTESTGEHRHSFFTSDFLLLTCTLTSEPATSRWSQARARCQSRCAVRSGIESASAVSRSDMPANSRHSATWTSRSLTAASASKARSSASSTDGQAPAVAHRQRVGGDLDALPVAAALVRRALARVVDQDVPHGARRDGEEVRAAFPPDCRRHRPAGDTRRGPARWC